jgi:hypothetical protein
MNLYIVDYWIPFPSSEYGGLFVVAAANKTQLMQLLRNWDDNNYPGALEQSVQKSESYALKKDIIVKPEIIKAFIT